MNLRPRLAAGAETPQHGGSGRTGTPEQPFRSPRQGTRPHTPSQDSAATRAPRRLQPQTAGRSAPAHAQGKKKKHPLLSRCPGALPACLPRSPSRGGNSTAGACVLVLPCSIQRGPPQFQVIPPLPRNAGPIARVWAGLSGHGARPRAARAAQAARRLAGAAGAGARFLLGVGGARAAEAARRLQVSARTCRGCSRACVHERRAARVPAGEAAGKPGCGGCEDSVLRPLLTAAAAAPEPPWEGPVSPPAALPVRPSGRRGAPGPAQRGPRQVR